MGYMEQLRLPANHESLPLHTHLCLMLRVRFLLREQIEVGCHDDVRSLVRSVWKNATDNNESQRCKLSQKSRPMLQFYKYNVVSGS